MVFRLSRRFLPGQQFFAFSKRGRTDRTSSPGDAASSTVTLPQPTLSLAQVVLFLAVAFLAIVVEVLILRAILNNNNTIELTQRENFTITSLANIQREALRLEIEAERALGEPEINTSPLELQRGLLANQLRLLSSGRTDDPRLMEDLREIQLGLDRYDILIAELVEASPEERPLIASAAKSILSTISFQIKSVYDEEEKALFFAASNSLRNQRISQYLMLSVGALVMILGAVLTVSMRRSFRHLSQEMTERSRAEESERDRNRELETLFNLAGILAQPGLFLDRCTKVLQDLARIVDADKASLRSVDDQGQILHLIAQAGPQTWDLAKIISLQSISGLALSRGEIIAANDYESHPMAHRAEIEKGIKSVVSVPITVGGKKASAVLNVVSQEPGHFTPGHTRLLAAIGDGLGALLDQAKMAEDLEASLEDMAGVDEVARIITSTLDLEEVYTKFTSEMKKLVPFEQAYIHLVDQETGDYSIKRLYGVSQADGAPSISQIPEGSHLQALVENPQTIVRDDIENGQRQYNDLSHLYMGLRSSITVPITTKGRVVGALELLNRHASAYGPRERSILERLARHMAPAVENSRLFDQTRAEEAKATGALSQLWAVLDGVEAGIVLANDDQEPLWANRRFGELFSMDSSIDDSAPVIRFAVPETLKERSTQWPSIQNAFADAEGRISADRDYAGAVEEVQIDGPTKRTVQRFTTSVTDGLGERIGRLWVFYDISEQRRLEDQIIQSRKMETVGRLAGGVAHDFNNMLSVININAELAMRHAADDEGLIAYLEDITQATQRAANLTRQLLIFSRRQVLEPKVLDLNDLINDLYKMLRQLIDANIEFVIPTPAEKAMAKVDPSQIEQVLMNLAINASDAMPNGGNFTIETRNLSLSADDPDRPLDLAPGDYVTLFVSDTGIGIGPDDKDHIFEPFYTTKETGKGTGLGLATCYGIITQSNGYIDVESAIGKGSTFKIYLPQDSTAAEAHEEAEVAIPLPRGAETVLIVEDEPMVLSTAVRVLTDQGYTVLEASNGEEGLRVAEHYASGAIDLLLTDSVMPKMGGAELAEKLREQRPEIKVLFTSGYMDYDRKDLGQGFKGEHIAFIQKPLTPETLAIKVREVLDPDGAWMPIPAKIPEMAKAGAKAKAKKNGNHKAARKG